MTPEEKPSSAERAAENYGNEQFAAYAWPWGQTRNAFLAGAEWKAARVAEAVAKLEKLRTGMKDYRKKTSPSEDRHEMGHAVSANVLDEIDAAIALLKGTK